MGEKGRHRHESGQKRGNSMYLVLIGSIIIVGLVAAIGLVMNFLNFGDNEPININMQAASSNPDIPNGDSGDAGISNSEIPKQDNLGVIIMTLSMQIAGKNCEIVYDDFEQCFSNGFPQAALSGSWFDACAVFAQSADRSRSVKFSLPLAQTPTPVFLTRRGNPAGFNPDSLSGAKIGLLRSWWSDEFCVFTLTDYQLRESQIVFYTDSNFPAMVAGLQNGAVDAVFISDDLPPATDGTFEIAKKFEACLVGGESLMMRKDSLLKSWWDPAFTKLVNSREYREICDDIDDPFAHGTLPGKNADEVCVHF